MVKKIITTIKNFRYLFLLYLLVAILLMANALFEMQQSKKELLELMKNQSEATLHSVVMSSENLIKNNHQTQQIIEHHLARILQLFNVLSKKVNDNLINQILSETDLDGLFFIDSTYTPFLIAGKFKYLPLEQLNRLFSKAFEMRAISGDTVFWQETLTDKQDTLQYRFGCIFLPDEKILMLIGKSNLATASTITQADFGTLIRDLAAQVPNIIFLALQDSSGVIAAAGQLEFLDRPVKQTILQSGQPAFKILDFDSISIFEAESPFFYQGKNIGLFRLGLSTEALENINQRIYQRLMILSLILIGVALLILTFAFIRQRYDILHKQYMVIETYSSNIIENVSDAIIVFDLIKGIKIFNKSAEQLFNRKRQEVLGKTLDECGCPFLQNLSETFEQIQEIEITTCNELKTVLVSHSSFKDSDGQENRILVLRDISRQKQMEERMKRQEQLTAIGQLAAGVAHEIRNPLNSISTIVQQLKRDFKPLEDQELYTQLTDIVYHEVKRINQKINEFLRFSKPEPVRPGHFILSEWLQSIIAQYRPTFKERQIEFGLAIDWDGKVFWDASQMRDALSNLIQNALDAMPNGGQLAISVQKEGEKIILSVKDSGRGIPSELKDKIFNLYFTTKPDGTGIGLSLVQRIVFEHDGFIKMESEPGHGTIFKILLPQEIDKG